MAKLNSYKLPELGLTEVVSRRVTSMFMRKTVGLILTVSLVVLVGLVVQPSGGVAQNLQENTWPKLGPRLYKVVAAYEGKIGVASSGMVSGVDLAGETVRVIAEANSVAEAVQALQSLGCTIETTYRNLVQVSAPLSALKEIAQIPSIDRVELPPIIRHYAITSEGLSLMRAPSWHGRGLTGAGVKVAIIDSGFQGYQSLLGTELPSAPTVRSFRQDENIEGDTVHGTACAEIVYDIAPDAQFYLVNFESHAELGNAVDWLIEEGVDIISSAIGFPGLGPDDGTSIVDQMVDKARENGILWAVAAGNDAQRHWAGAWKDEDGDHYLDFEPGPDADESMSVKAESGDRIWAVLKWDDPWGASSNDYDLYLSYGGNRVDSSERPQDGTGNPVEVIDYEVQEEEDESYHLLVYEKAGAQPVNFHLFIPDYGLERWVEEGSVVSPATSLSAMTVGAVSAQGPLLLELFSSRGPTVDGRIKPDILAPDKVTTFTRPTFLGTSAAAPHAAGAAVLAKQAFPGYSPDQIQDFLETEALDLGPSGKDHVYGSGLVSLDPPQTWFVDDDGVEYPDADFTKIQDALDAAAPGDSVIVHDGLYTENLTLDKPVSLKAETTYPGAARIDRNEAERIVVQVNSTNSTVEGFKITNTAGDSPAGLVFGIWVKGADYNLVQDNIIYGSWTDLRVSYMNVEIPPWWYNYPIRPEHNRIIGNWVVNSEGHGLHLLGDGNVVSANYVQQNWGDGIFVSGDDNLFVGNSISQNNQEGLVIVGESNIVSNNVVDSNRYGGIIMRNATENIVKNNIFTGNGGTGYTWPTPGLSIESGTDNLIYHNTFREKVRRHAWDEDGTSTWDDGALGNYWDDYTGQDANQDGIGDTPYEIPGDIVEKAQDRFPLMEPYAGKENIVGQVSLQGQAGVGSSPYGLQIVSSEPVEGILFERPIAEGGGFDSGPILEGVYTVTAYVSGYLPAYISAVAVEAGKTTTLPEVTLLAGDVYDKVIDISDLALVASHFNTSPPGRAGADINKDGLVDIYDLVLVGMNFGKTEGPWPGEPVIQ